MARRAPELSPVRRRWVLACVLLALLGGTLARFAHQITVPHRLCQVHGTIEHGLDDGPASRAELARGPDAGGPKVRPVPGAHEECEFATFARTEHALVLAAPRVVLARLEPCAKAFFAAELPPESARYRWAPSRAPPA